MTGIGIGFTNEKKHGILKAFNVSANDSIQRCFTYYQTAPYKYLHFCDGTITSKTIPGILETIGADGKSYPFNLQYLIIVIAETDEKMNGKWLEFIGDAGELVVFLLHNRNSGDYYYPKHFQFPLRYAYRKDIKKILSVLTDADIKTIRL